VLIHFVGFQGFLVHRREMKQAVTTADALSSFLSTFILVEAGTNICKGGKTVYDAGTALTRLVGGSSRPQLARLPFLSRSFCGLRALEYGR
jgi:hypothetical protein